MEEGERCLMPNASLKGPTTARSEETETRSSGDLADSDPYHLFTPFLFGGRCDGHFCDPVCIGNGWVMEGGQNGTRPSLLPTRQADKQSGMTGRILVVVLHLKDRYMGRERGLIGRGHNDERSLDLAQFMPRFVMDCCGGTARGFVRASLGRRGDKL